MTRATSYQHCALCFHGDLSQTPKALILETLYPKPQNPKKTTQNPNPGAQKKPKPLILVNPYIHTYIHTYIQACIHTYIHTSMHALNMYIPKIHTCSTYIDTHARAQSKLHVYMKVQKACLLLHISFSSARVPRSE